MIGDFFDTAIVVLLSVLVVLPASLAILRTVEDRWRRAVALRGLEVERALGRAQSR
ncbi:MAG: hypothetical protein OEM59_09865 [Rhodospirillales bacterium]|nr:hypothetical protein [Rhodospirillales bacterium]